MAKDVDTGRVEEMGLEHDVSPSPAPLAYVTVQPTPSLSCSLSPLL